MNINALHVNSMRDFIKSIFMFFYTYCAPVPLRNIKLRCKRKSLVTVVTYHRVDDDPQDINAVSVENFDRQMAFLKQEYQIITVNDLIDIIKIGLNAERKVLITFDDGYLDNYRNAVPILQKYKLPACFFITSGIVGTEKAFDHDLKRLGRKVPAMSWEQVKELKHMGFEIGAHTINHVRVGKCEHTVLLEEICGSKKMIEEKIGVAVKYFSHPHGLLSDISPAALSVMRDVGFVCNFSAYGGLVIPGEEDIFDIRRIGIPDHSSLLFFKAWLEGWRTQN